MFARGLILIMSMTTGSAAAADDYVRMATTEGDIYIELFEEAAPKTVENFLAYVRSGFYDGTIFHRVIPNFVLQGGGYTEDLERKPTRAPIPNEADNGLSNDTGTLSMARTGDPHSATSQFFINVADNKPLDHTGKTHSNAWGYAVFGRVVRGMDVVEAIRTKPTGAKGPFRSDVPQETVTITEATVVSELPAE